MVALEILTWWYSQGWSQVTRNAMLRFDKVSHLFSVPILIRTWFDPWRRIMTYPAAGVDAQVRAMVDNLVSRFVGFTVRTLVLLTVGILFVISAVLAFIQIILWPLVPVVIVLSVILGIVGSYGS